jgi:hypothetical protein
MMICARDGDRRHDDDEAISKSKTRRYGKKVFTGEKNNLGTTANYHYAK